MKKRAMSLALTLFMLISLLPTLTLPVSAETPGTEMDALTALGIDSSAAPEGYDANSLDNPYGRNTVELTPVNELYTVGLQNKVAYPASYDTTNTALQNGNNKEAHITTAANALQASLYGNDAWTQTTVSGIMGNGDTLDVKSGTTTTTGDYTLITTGTVNSAAASFDTLPAIALEGIGSIRNFSSTPSARVSSMS